MHGLEVPEVASSLRVHGDNRVRKHVRAGPIAAVVICGGTRNGQVRDPARLVDGCREAPHVRAAAVFPAVAPRVVEPLARARNGLKFPELCARAHVEPARIARRSLRHLAARGADDRNVAIDRRRAAVRHPDVRHAVRAEAGCGRTGRRVDRNQVRAAHEQDARGQIAFTGPIAHAARRNGRWASGAARARRRCSGPGGRCRRCRRRRWGGQHVGPDFGTRVCV